MARTTSGKRTSQKNRAAYRATRSASSTTRTTSPAAATTAPISASAATSAAGSSTIATLAMDREREYGFIRADLKRMLITAGILLVVMLALLFVID